jgi:endonuclease III
MLENVMPVREKRDFYTESEAKALIPVLCQILHDVYGSPHWSNKPDPFDEIIYILLSTKTEYTKFNMTYERFKERFPDYLAASEASEGALFDCIRLGGLGEVKAKQIKRILLKIREDNPTFSRKFFDEMSDKQLEDYLTSLYGIGIKAARCVMMYSLRRKVLPVDVHTLRVSKRMGLVPPDISFKQADKMLQDLVPSDLRFTFHVNMIAHGKKYCRRSKPKCELCPLKEFSKKNIGVV